MVHPDKNRVFITQSIDLDQDGSPDLVTYHELSEKDKETLEAIVIVLLKFGILVGGAIVFCIALGLFLEWISTWTVAAWWGVGTISYFLIPSVVVGCFRESIRSAVVTFGVLLLAIAVPAILYLLVACLMSWDATAWVLASAASLILAVYGWLVTQLNNNNTKNYDLLNSNQVTDHREEARHYRNIVETENTFSYICHNCRKKYSISNKQIGSRFKCRKCGAEQILFLSIVSDR